MAIDCVPVSASMKSRRRWAGMVMTASGFKTDRSQAPVCGWGTRYVSTSSSSQSHRNGRSLSGSMGPRRSMATSFTSTSFSTSVCSRNR